MTLQDAARLTSPLTVHVRPVAEHRRGTPSVGQGGAAALTIARCRVPGTRSVNSHQHFAFSRHTAVACAAASSHASDCQPPAVNRRYLLSVLVDETAEDPRASQEMLNRTVAA